MAALLVAVATGTPDEVPVGSQNLKAPTAKAAFKC